MDINAIIQTPTPDLDRSRRFYTKAGFEPSADNVYTDGRAVIEINPDPFARTAVKLFSDDWADVLLGLRETFDTCEHEGTWVAAAPSGVRVYLVKGEGPAKPSGSAFGRFGSFAGVSIEAVNSEREVAFWRCFGYEVVAGGPDQGWVGLSNQSGVDVAVMPMRVCPHLFPNPGLTYFNSGRNLEILAAIREAGIPLSEEITRFNEDNVVDNAVVHDPGGTGFFIFND